MESRLQSFGLHCVSSRREVCAAYSRFEHKAAQTTGRVQLRLYLLEPGPVCRPANLRQSDGLAHDVAIAGGAVRHNVPPQFRCTAQHSDNHGPSRI